MVTAAILNFVNGLFLPFRRMQNAGRQILTTFEGVVSRLVETGQWSVFKVVAAVIVDVP
jgi:hypothetical protein